MSNAPSTLDGGRPVGFPDDGLAELPNERRAGLRKLAGSGFELLTAKFQFVWFWLAVLFPLAYAPLLVGPLATSETVIFASLLVLHAVALVGGHGYRSD